MYVGKIVFFSFNDKFNGILKGKEIQKTILLLDLLFEINLIDHSLTLMI